MPNLCSNKDKSYSDDRDKVGRKSDSRSGWANLGLGCGNPQAIVALQPREVVLDLGSGDGFDCFLASRQVGASGRVIGVDMTPEMVSRACENASKSGFTNNGISVGRDRASAGSGPLG